MTEARADRGARVRAVWHLERHHEVEPKIVKPAGKIRNITSLVRRQIESLPRCVIR